MERGRLILILCLVIPVSWARGQVLPPLGPVELEVDWGEIYGAVKPGDATNLLDIFGMFELNEAEVPVPKGSDFFKKKKKRKEYHIRETAGWLLDFALSGRLADYLDKAHSAYIILSEDEKKMHEKFFDTYVTVGPEIIGGTEVARVIHTTQNILDKITAIKQMIHANQELISDKEYSYLIGLLDKVLKLKQQQLYEFQNLTTDGVLVATQAQRMDLITIFHKESRKYAQGLDKLYAQLASLLIARRDNQLTDGNMNKLFNYD